jgi:hypothetical protein
MRASGARSRDGARQLCACSGDVSAIDDYAEPEMGNREYFWNRPHSVG